MHHHCVSIVADPSYVGNARLGVTGKIEKAMVVRGRGRREVFQPPYLWVISGSNCPVTTGTKFSSMRTIGHRLRRPEKRGEEEQEATLHKRSCQRHSRRCSGNLDAQSMIHGCVWRKKRGMKRDPMLSCLQDRRVQRLIRRSL